MLDVGGAPGGALSALPGRDDGGEGDGEGTDVGEGVMGGADGAQAHSWRLLQGIPTASTFHRNRRP